ncbi:Beta-galactosidase bgaB [Limihaloglobus sulfuriphilus]|uniref:beta-galactosidase n=1 Tax=Limihaloglobus sulfuriphilus TaxID=1851148 RepID=A0A1Q2ME78_9BACT|nr:beta-galactosidase [Limihaloglobus sulfuriphilus]AQQ71006.1 Beta-galactosidase bgaB [Limihaloglobus sulfuriphilus]
MFPIGTQYHRPPTPKMEKWEYDFKTMKEHGFNIIRGWAMWGWLNPKQGHYDFSELERLCDLGAENDIKVILLVNLESSPAWLYKKYPDTLYVDHKGVKVMPHTVHNTCCGGFPGHCLDWPDVRAHAEDFIEKLVTKFASHPALYGWEPHNEPLHEPARYYLCSDGELFCYCPKTLEKFTQWLREKYNNDINLLNNTWQRRYGEFDEVIPPIERGSYSDWTDWRLFHIESLVEQDRWRTQAIRDNDPQHPVMIHTRSGASGRNIVYDCTDDWRLSKLVDKFGFANFPESVSMLDHALAGDINRAAAGGKEFWMHELQSGSYGIGLDLPGPELSGERLAGWAWTTISQGAKGLLFWQYRTEQFGAEYGFNLVKLDGTPTQRLTAAAKIGETIREHEKLFDELKTVPAEVAIGYSPMNPLMLYVADGTVKPFDESYLGIYRMLCNLNVASVDIVRTDSQVVDDDFDKYKVLYLPLPLWIDEKTSAKIAAYVEQGGTIVSEPSLAFIETDFFSADTVPGMGLNKIFGCRREIISNSKDKILKIKAGNRTLSSRFLREILIPESAQVLGTYDNGEPAITVNNYGKGKAVYLGTNIFNNYYHQPSADVREFFQQHFHGNLKSFARTSNESTFVKIMETDAVKVVFLFNMADDDISTKLTVNLNITEAEDIYSHKKIQFEAGEQSSSEIHMKPHETCILLIK